MKEDKDQFRKHLLQGVLVGITAAGAAMTVAVIILFIQGRFRRTGLRPHFLPVYDDRINVNSELKTVRRKYASKTSFTQPTIFVAISSFRDPELCVTIEDLFKKAAYPERLSVGIVEQNDPSDPTTCHASNANIDKDKIKIITMNYKDAKGPTYARSICEGLWDGQEYYLMCDSHMRFEPGWDVEALEMLWKTKRPKRTIITWYCEGFERIQNDKGLRYKILIRRGWRYEQLKYFNMNGILEFESMTSFAPTPKTPQYVPMYSANFAFSHSDILKDAPYPGNTPMLFFGEEQYMAMKAFTHGWDLCGMTHSIAYHLWVRGYRKVYFDGIEKADIRDKSVQWIKDVMTEKVVDPDYGLGYVRSAQEFWDYLGVDFENRKFTRPTKPWKPPKGWTTIQDEFCVN